jgi:SAM-dependent methyltransferase
VTQPHPCEPPNHYDALGVDGYDADLYGLVGLGRERALLQVTPHLRPGMAVLDVACGTGTWLQALAARADIQCTGVDISREMLLRAGDKVRVKTVRADARDLLEHVPPQSMDLAATHFTFGFVEPRPVIQAVRAVLRPRGLYSVVNATTGAFQRLQELAGTFIPRRDVLASTHAPASVGMLESWLEADGFTLVESATVEKHFTISSEAELFELALGVGWFAQYGAVFAQLKQRPGLVESLLPIHDRFEACAVLARKGEPA